jgi:hypothetical protein
MLCPNCKSATKVINSRRDPDGRIRRRRACVNAECEGRFSTIEDDVRIAKARDDLETIQKSVDDRVTQLVSEICEDVFTQFATDIGLKLERLEATMLR